MRSVVRRVHFRPLMGSPAVCAISAWILAMTSGVFFPPTDVRHPPGAPDQAPHPVPTTHAVRGRCFCPIESDEVGHALVATAPVTQAPHDASSSKLTNNTSAALSSGHTGERLPVAVVQFSEAYENQFAHSLVPRNVVQLKGPKPPSWRRSMSCSGGEAHRSGLTHRVVIAATMRITATVSQRGLRNTVGLGTQRRHRAWLR